MNEVANRRGRLRRLLVEDLGRVGYGEAYELQSARRAAILDGRSLDSLFLLEHPPVFTLGRNAAAKDVLASAGWLKEHGVEVHQSDRGGQVTYHGPGQLVGYPVINLHPDRRDIRRYVRDLQEVLVRALAKWDIAARGGEGERIGVWTEEETPRKIASIGIHLKRWVTAHGFALNVATDLDHFQGIVACGLQNVVMVSMAELLGAAPERHEVVRTVVDSFVEVFNCTVERSS